MTMSTASDPQPIPLKITDAACVTVNGTTYVAGGIQDAPQSQDAGNPLVSFSSVLWALPLGADLQTGWVRLLCTGSDLCASKTGGYETSGAALAPIGSHLLLLGGVDWQVNGTWQQASSTQGRSTVLELVPDLTTQSFTIVPAGQGVPVANLSQQRADFPAFVTPSSLCAVMGLATTNAIECYDLKTGTRLGFSSSSHGVDATPAVGAVAGNQILLTGDLASSATSIWSLSFNDTTVDGQSVQSAEPQSLPCPYTNVDGRWSGTLSQPGTDFDFELDLSQCGTRVSGTSNTQSGEYYVKMQLQGTVNGMMFSFSEESPPLESNAAQGTYWCIKSVQLDWLPACPERLEGTWQQLGCNSGTVSLIRQ